MADLFVPESSFDYRKREREYGKVILGKSRQILEFLDKSRFSELQLPQTPHLESNSMIMISFAVY